jgi:hypothetical protein
MNVSLLLVILVVCIILYLLLQYRYRSKNVIEHFYSKCCPDKYPDLVYDWHNKPTCYNKKNMGADPKPNCLPPNFLKLPFNNDQKPKNYIF